MRADRAGAIRLHVQGLSLPRNAELYVYSRKGEAFGPYTGTGPNGTGSFWSTALFGSEAILQLRFSGPVRTTDLRAASFQESAANTGLDKPTLTIAIKFDDNKKDERVSFAKTGTDVFASIMGQPGVAKVLTSEFDEAIKALDEVSK